MILLYVEQIRPTTNLLSNATNILLKAKKICYGQLSDQLFAEKLISFDFIITAQ